MAAVAGHRKALAGTLRERTAEILHGWRAASEKAAPCCGAPGASDPSRARSRLLPARLVIRWTVILAVRCCGSAVDCARAGTGGAVSHFALLRAHPVAATLGSVLLACARIYRLLRGDHSIRRRVGDRTDTERTRGGGGRRASLRHPRGLQGRQAGAAGCAAHPLASHHRHRRPSLLRAHRLLSAIADAGGIAQFSLAEARAKAAARFRSNSRA